MAGQMNFSIPQPQQIDVLGNIQRAIQIGQVLKQQRAQQGASMAAQRIIQGGATPENIAELGKYDPNAALRIQGQQSQMQATAEQTSQVTNRQLQAQESAGKLAKLKATLGVLADIAKNLDSESGAALIKAVLKSEDKGLISGFKAMEAQDIPIQFKDGIKVFKDIIDPESGRPILAGLTESGEAIPVSGVGFDRIAPSPTRTQEVRGEGFLLDKGFQPATEEQVGNKALGGKIRLSEDTKKPFIKLEQMKPKDLDAIVAIDDVIANLGDAVEQVKEFGLSPDPVTGRIPIVGDAINVFTKSTEWQAWQSKVDRQFQNWRKIITGAQASNQELKNLIPLMPTSKDRDPEVFTRKALDVINEMSNKRARIVKIFGDSGFDVAGISDPPRSSITPTGVDPEKELLEITAQDEAQAEQVRKSPNFDPETMKIVIVGGGQ